ncbi:MAG: Glucose-6-phosphate 1-dehydrogenase [Syntrophorhabdaceae bacterium PtaU1.Bin034]|nr:MAG: Glucose-6-phosphate 1-dehydrogenase [Syntrophorhabdaceae bacterium PtaU1.Bin034]
MSDEIIVDSRYLQTCDIRLSETELHPFTLVIFGGGGDLSRRKLIPSLFHLFKEKELPRDFSILAFDRLELDDARYRKVMEEAIRASDQRAVEKSVWEDFSGHLFYLCGSFEKSDSFERLRERVDRVGIPASTGTKDVIYYMAVPPHAVPLAVEKLKDHALCKGLWDARIVVEKPFGENRESAARLNRLLTGAFDEKQIYRIDHYLAKEPVENITFFRFSNTIFEEVWNRRYVDSVQITVAEDIGIEHRGVFYEKAGVVRDILQNHLLQLLSLMAMEAPSGFTPDLIRDEKVKIMRSIRPVDADYIDRYMVRGQYGEGRVGDRDEPGYRREPNVAAASRTATFFAGKFYIDNLRWAGVPFYLRTGKRLAKRITEICIQFKRLPLRLFGRTCDVLDPDVLFLTIQPDEVISLRFLVKYPYSSNQVYPVRMDFSYKEAFKTPHHEAYEQILLDLMRGDLTLFVREDTIEEMWSVVDPIDERWESIPPDDFPNYRAGTWGPAAAERLMEQEGRRWLTR